MRRFRSFLLFLLIPCAFAEEPGGSSTPRVELEYVASDIFRSGMAVVKVWRRVHVETEYFGGPPYDVAVSGVSWKFEWKGLTLSPGFGVGYGSPVKTAPMGTLRWSFESKHWFSQGFFTKSVTGQEDIDENGVIHEVGVAILDNNHFSLRLGRFEIGPLWERIKYREEQEWKGGVRAAVRWKKFKGIFQTVGPEVEFRGGIAFEY